MPTNLIKIYNQLLEIVHLSEHERIVSLKRIFNRDICENEGFNFRTKIIRPFKAQGQSDMETLFSHLTCMVEEQIDEAGKKIKSRTVFDYERSKRLHWVKHHIDETAPDKIDVFSYTDRINGKDVIRTYIHDNSENYVVVLEPQRSHTDYYLITAYHLSKELGGVKQIKNKSKKRLPEVY